MKRSTLENQNVRVFRRIAEKNFRVLRNYDKLLMDIIAQFLRKTQILLMNTNFYKLIAKFKENNKILNVKNRTGRAHSLLFTKRFQPLGILTNANLCQSYLSIYRCSLFNDTLSISG